MKNSVFRLVAASIALMFALVTACATEDVKQSGQPSVDPQDDGSASTSLPPQEDDGNASELLQGPIANVNGCLCYTTCSSNGRQWTRTYFVTTASSPANCSTLAIGFCRAKSSDYRYHNSACTH